MRWLRWGIGGLVGLLLFALSTALVVGSLSSYDCDAIAITGGATILGTATSVNGSVVTVQVDEVIEQLPFGSPPVSEGDEIKVMYHGGDQRFLHQGQQYRVRAFPAVDGFTSGVQNAGECSTTDGDFTRHADGSPINTGLFTRDGARPYFAPVGAALALSLALLASIPAVHRKRHPRLTVDGQPRQQRSTSSHNA